MQDIRRKALFVDSETDPKGTVVGVIDAVDFDQMDPKKLLESCQAFSRELFEAVLADRDRLLGELAKERAEKVTLAGDLQRSHDLVAYLEGEIERMKARVKRT